MPWPPTAGHTCALSPTSSRRPARRRAATRSWKRAKFSQGWAGASSVRALSPVSRRTRAVISSSVGGPVRDGSSSRAKMYRRWSPSGVRKAPSVAPGRRKKRPSPATSGKRQRGRALAWTHTTSGRGRPAKRTPIARRTTLRAPSAPTTQAKRAGPEARCAMAPPASASTPSNASPQRTWPPSASKRRSSSRSTTCCSITSGRAKGLGSEPKRSVPLARPWTWTCAADRGRPSASSAGPRPQPASARAVRGHTTAARGACLGPSARSTTTASTPRRRRPIASASPAGPAPAIRTPSLTARASTGRRSSSACRSARRCRTRPAGRRSPAATPR